MASSSSIGNKRHFVENEVPDTFLADNVSSKKRFKTDREPLIEKGNTVNAVGIGGPSSHYEQQSNSSNSSSNEVDSSCVPPGIDLLPSSVVGPRTPDEPYPISSDEDSDGEDNHNLVIDIHSSSPLPSTQEYSAVDFSDDEEVDLSVVSEDSDDHSVDQADISTDVASLIEISDSEEEPSLAEETDTSSAVVHNYMLLNNNSEIVSYADAIVFNPFTTVGNYYSETVSHSVETSFNPFSIVNHASGTIAHHLLSPTNPYSVTVPYYSETVSVSYSVPSPMNPYMVIADNDSEIVSHYNLLSPTNPYSVTVPNDSETISQPGTSSANANQGQGDSNNSEDHDTDNFSTPKAKRPALKKYRMSTLPAIAEHPTPSPSPPPPTPTVAAAAAAAAAAAVAVVPATNVEDANEIPQRPCPRTCLAHPTCMYPQSQLDQYQRHEPLTYKFLNPENLSTRWPDSYATWQVMIRKENQYHRDSILFTDNSENQRHPDLDCHNRVERLHWMSQITERLACSTETYYLAVDYFDRYLSASQNLDETNIVALSVVALFYAIKMEHGDLFNVREFLNRLNNPCTQTDFCSYQQALLETLKFRMSSVTVNAWLTFYLRVAKLDLNSQESDVNVMDVDINHYFYHEVCQLINLCLMDHGSMKFSYRIIAATALFYCTVPQFAMTVTNTSWDELKECYFWMRAFYKKFDKEQCQKEKHIISPEKDNYGFHCHFRGRLVNFYDAYRSRPVRRIRPLFDEKLSHKLACLCTHWSQMGMTYDPASPPTPASSSPSGSDDRERYQPVVSDVSDDETCNVDFCGIPWPRRDPPEIPSTSSSSTATYDVVMSRETQADS